METLTQSVRDDIYFRSLMCGAAFDKWLDCKFVVCEAGTNSFMYITNSKSRNFRKFSIQNFLQCVIMSSLPPKVVEPDALLRIMRQVSSCVFSYQSQTTPTANCPRVIILCGWMNAKSSHLAKFVRQYHKLFPSSDIILIRPSLEHFLRPEIARTSVEPAIDVLRAGLNDNSSSPSGRPELLVHIFSNGGSGIAYHLTHLYTAHTGGSCLPRRVTIFDSGPAPRFVYDDVLAAVLVDIPPGPNRESKLVPAARRLCASMEKRFQQAGPEGDYLRQWAQLLNDPAQAKEDRRLYLYSDVDKLIPQKEIESHADEAEARGFAVGRELFLGSQHVSREFIPLLFYRTHLLCFTVLSGADLSCL